MEDDLPTVCAAQSNVPTNKGTSNELTRAVTLIEKSMAVTPLAEKTLKADELRLNWELGKTV